jgi:hypothetical protein
MRGDSRPVMLIDVVGSLLVERMSVCGGASGRVGWIGMRDSECRREGGAPGL